MAESRARLDWLRTSTATARVLSAFGRRSIPDDWLVPPGLLDGVVREKLPEPPKLPVDVLIDIFVKQPPKAT